MQNNIQHKTAIVLSGCGFLDGTDVIEAASVIIGLSKMGKTPEFFAPGNKVYTPINHQLGHPVDGDVDERNVKERNVTVESARILGRVFGLSDFNQTLATQESKLEEYDALVILGGYGVLSNLCSGWQFPSPEAKAEQERIQEVCDLIEPNQDLKEVVRRFHRAGKALAMCGTATLIAPLLLQDNNPNHQKVKVYFGRAKSVLLQRQQNQLDDISESVEEQESNGFYFDDGYNLYTTPATFISLDPAEHLVYNSIEIMLGDMQRRGKL